VEVLDLKTVTKKLYEAMFLVDSAKAAADWEGLQRHIRNILERAEAEIVSIKKWDERKLAYDIGRNSRGTYVLCYFNGNGRKNAEDIEKDTPATLAERRSVAAEAEPDVARQVEGQKTDTEPHAARSGGPESPSASDESHQESEQADALHTGGPDEPQSEEPRFEPADETGRPDEPQN
jgi:small subunit ribosomal protein S6